MEQREREMRSCFVKREYPEKLTDSKIMKVKFNMKKLIGGLKGKMEYLL